MFSPHIYPYNHRNQEMLLAWPHKTVDTNKRMEGLNLNKILHDDVRIMIVELQGLKGFCKLEYACVVAFCKFKFILSLGRYGVSYGCKECLIFFSVVCSVSTDLNQSVLLR